MRKMNSLIVMTICLVLIPCVKTHGWGITYTHPALTHYGIGGSELAPYHASLLADWVLTWDYNDYYPTITLRLKEAKESPYDYTRTVSEWIHAGCKIEDTRLFVEARSSHHFHDPLRNAGLNNTEGGIHIREPGGHDFAEAFTKLKHNQEVIQI